VEICENPWLSCFWDKLVLVTKRKSKGAYMISAVAEMLSRFAGVSEAGARRRNPEPSEGSL